MFKVPQNDKIFFRGSATWIRLKTTALHPKSKTRLIPCDPWVNVVLVLEGLDGEGQRGWGWGRAEGRRKDVGDVGDEPERQRPGENH